MQVRPIMRTGVSRPTAYTGIDERDARYSRKPELKATVDGLKGDNPSLNVIKDYKKLFATA